MAAKSDFVASFKAMPIGDQASMLGELTAIHSQAKEAKRAELMAELQALGGAPVEAPKRIRGPNKPKEEGDARAVVKPNYRAPDGFEWSGRGAIPKVFKALGVTDKAGMEQFRIKD